MSSHQKFQNTVPVLMLMIGGCIPLLPPPHRASVTPPIVNQQDKRTDIGLALSPVHFLTGNVSHVSALGDGPLMLELAGRVGPRSGGFSPGLWIRTTDKLEDGHSLGLRTGVVTGTGDVLGEVPWRLPYIGPSIHIQRAVRTNKQRELALTFGGEYAVPFINSVEILDGDGMLEFPMPSLYASMDFAYSTPVGQGNGTTLGLGLGVDAELQWGALMPRTSISLGF